jgi:hypothetical protein
MTTNKLPLQPSPEEAAQMRADRLTLPVERDERTRIARELLCGTGYYPALSFGPRIEFTGEKK